MIRNHLFLILFLLGVVTLVFWRARQRNPAVEFDLKDLPKPDDHGMSDETYAIGGATGMMGGSVADAAVVKYAVKRTKEEGREIDPRDVGFALGMEQQISKPPDKQT